MNWAVLSLPLVVSISFLLATAGLYMSVNLALKDTKVPTLRRQEPDISKIKEAFSKVFPESKLPKKVITGTGPTSRSVSLDIELLGTSVGVKSMALLKVGKRTLVLGEGQSKEGIKLIKVSKKSAVVEVGDKEIELKLKPGRRNSSTPDRSYAGRTPSAEFRISRRELERITKDPGIMFRQIRLVPYVKNGRTEGFMFEWVKPGSLFYKAGLRKGDILLSINNMTIQSGEDAFRLLQILRNEPNLRVVVLRNGQKKEINIRIE